MPTIFLFLLSRLLTYINPTTLMDANQQVRALLLFLLFEPCVFYSHHTTQKIYLHHRHAIFLVVLVSQTNQEHTSGMSTSLLHISCVFR